MPGPDHAFGKLPKRSDSRTLQLPALITGKPAPKAEVENETAVERPWGTLGNDTLRDCACAAAGHAEMLWASLYGQRLPDPTQGQIVDAYSQITGYKQDDETTDKGADLLSVLKYWQSTGIAGQKIRAFAEIPSRDITTLKWSIASFGVAYVGLQLPSAWEVVPDFKKFATRRRLYDPATWQNAINGHCVIYTGYSQNDVFTCVTWNRVMTVSPAFHRAYCDEAYAIIPTELVDGMAETTGIEALNDGPGPLEALNDDPGLLEALNDALRVAKSVPAC